jgi:micrococcal nuclease
MTFHRSRAGSSRLWGGAAAIAALAAALGIWLAIDGRQDGVVGAAPVTTAASAASVPPRPGDAFALTVDHVFDGDTIEARIATPNDVVPSTDSVRVRLIGVDAPEGTPSPECWADEARDRLRMLLPEGSVVWAAPDIQWRDRYDRVLLYVWTEDGRFVNHELALAGDAVALLVEPNRAHFTLLSEAEGSARAAGAGQWGGCG